jgi:hypothetical protein
MAATVFPTLSKTARPHEALSSTSHSRWQTDTRGNLRTTVGDREVARASSRGARSAGVPSTTSCGRQPMSVWEPLRAASCSYLATSGSATGKGCVHFTEPQRSRSLAPRVISVPRARAAPPAMPRHPCQIALSWARARRRIRARIRGIVGAHAAPPIDTTRRNWEHSARWASVTTSTFAAARCCR